MIKIHPDAQAVLGFWYSEENKVNWFAKSDQFDQAIRAQFAQILEQGSRGELDSWRTTIQGRLAEIIVLDQFSRNLYRNTPRAFAQDTMALVLAQTAIELPEFMSLSESEKHFILMPYMHSESAYIHQKAVELFDKFTNPTLLDFEIKHKVIIDRFGRYPHRNAILGRQSSAEEIDFLQQPNSSF
ncbi:MAG: DUF924 family protein [Pasteurella oralis]|uniref:DUF924 family protein n=1 Tax=Pasteurella oralis TaxID=1071947 RepID=UPI002703D4AA|nr:DUF924 family protein [Pasteurella oralis]